LFLIYTVLVVFGTLILLVDLLVGLMLLIVLGRAVPLALHGTLVTGHVVKIEPRRRRSRRARVRVAYKTAAGMFETPGSSERPRIGEPHDVRYDPAHPSRATTVVRPARRAAVQVPMVLAIAALSAGMVVGSVFYFAGVHSGSQLPLAGGCLALGLALAVGYYAGGRYAVLLGWRRMTQTTGKVSRFDEHAPGGPGFLISFRSADGREEFWARSASLQVNVGDVVTVYYNPARPSRSATLETAADVRSYAVLATLLAVLFAAVGVFGLTSL